jgi:hypothetical protein
MNVFIQAAPLQQTEGSHLALPHYQTRPWHIQSQTIGNIFSFSFDMGYLPSPEVIEVKLSSWIEPPVTEKSTLFCSMPLTTLA